MSLSERWDDVLADLRRAGRYRTLTAGCGIDFSSNDYLGYSSAPLTLRGGSPSGTASRLLRGHHHIWDEVETALALWHGAEAAVMFTSGYAANEGLLSTVIASGDWVASDERNHASIIDGLRLSNAEKFIFRHRDPNALEDGLRDAVRARAGGRELFVVTESLFSMSGERTDLAALVGLVERYGAHVIVDEAHTTGCFGADGFGCVDASGLRGRVLATVHTGGKALGVNGAYVVGSSRLREILINRCRHFVFTTALPPAVGAWWLAMLERVRGDQSGREKLHENAGWFRRELVRHGLAADGTDYIVPLVIGDDRRAAAVADEVRRRGFDVRAIRPPSVPEGEALLRVSVHADHDRGTLAVLAGVLAELMRP